MKTLIKSTKKDKTPQIIVSMLKENTGSHFLDSGGAYGRNHERNAVKALKDFKNEPVITGSFYNNYCGDNPDGFSIAISGTRSLFHFLNENLTYDEKEDTAFNEFCNLPENKEKHYLELMEEYPDYLQTKGYEITGLYGDGKPFTVNSYNGDSMLSQVIQYTYFSSVGGCFVILQIHGGCDIRGGYTAPKVFRTYEECNFLGGGDDLAVICSNKNEHIWVSDDCGYHNYFQGSWNRPKLNKKAELFPDFVEGLPMPEAKDLGKYNAKELNFEDGKAYCPLCWADSKEKHELKIC